MDRQIYDNYRQSRNTNMVSALDSYMINGKSMIESYEESHKRLLENIDVAREIEKELAKRVLKLLEEQLL